MGNPLFYAYGFLAGALLTVFWVTFWFATSVGIALTLWARLETVKSWGTLGLFLVLMTLILAPIGVGLSLGVVLGVVGQALVRRLLNDWART